VASVAGSEGFRDAVAPPGSPYLYAVGEQPDAVVVFDLTAVEDDAYKDAITTAAVGSMPLPHWASAEDKGVTTGTRIAGAGMAIRDNVLFVTHFSDNALFAFDLDRGVFGEQIGRVDAIGENPHTVSITPDGRFALVANYLGGVDEGLTSGTLAVIDVDPDSPTYLEVLTWVTNN
jgi:hypothetical protein